MKKRITFLFLAVLMVLATVSTAAAANDDAGIMPLYNPCPLCQIGIIRSTLIDSRDVYLGRDNCPCYYPNYPADSWKYNCKKYVIRNTYQDICDNPKCNADFSNPVTRDSGYRWEHDACKGSGCGH